MTSERSKSGMAYFMTDTLLTMNHRAGGHVYERFNLVMTFADCVNAMLEDENKNDLVRLKLDEQLLAIDELQKNYNPKFDIDIYMSDARTIFETHLNNVLRELLKISYQKNLINPSMIGEVKAHDWT